MKLNESYRRLIPVVIVIALVWASTYTVSETDLVIVTLFGRPTRSISDAGLHVKWPFESILRFDRRLIVYDPGSSEFLTKDKKNLVLGSGSAGASRIRIASCRPSAMLEGTSS